MTTSRLHAMELAELRCRIISGDYTAKDYKRLEALLVADAKRAIDKIKSVLEEPGDE